MPVLADADAATLYRSLLLPRVIEERMLKLIRQGRIAKWFSGYGQEAISVGAAWALNDDDYMLPMHRNLGVWTTRGVPLKPLFCQLMGRDGGYTKGRDRTFHFGLPKKRIIGMISHMCAMLPVGCGIGTASKIRDEGIVAAAFTGEGGSREGDFHEALNLAGVWDLPVVFIVENNGYGLSTPTEQAVAVEDIADAAAGYGMPGEVVDGNDLPSVIDAVRRAADKARSGNGPTLLEMKTFRMRGHEEASGVKYVPEERFEEWRQKDPVSRFEEGLLANDELSEADLEAIRQELEQNVLDAAEYALDQPEVTSTRKHELRDVYARASYTLRSPQAETEELRFIDAINQSLHQAMEEDGDVLLMGQDIAEYEGVFKVTAGLLDRFGHDRVRNTPIIESGAIGAAFGLALQEMKPIVEIQYADFIACGFNQIVNNLAKTHYRWGQPVQITIRAPFGGGIGAGPFHSQSMEAWFTHVPGLKVVVPATSAEAKGLLMASIKDPNPVLFLEHKKMYRSINGEVPSNPYELELGSAEISREGSDVTIITYGIGVHWALEEASFQQEEHGVEVEVINLRTLLPWDRETVMESVRQTNRALVLTEASRTSGFAGEVVADISQEAFVSLDAPPVRVTAEDMPIPFAKQLEEDVYAAKPKLRRALKNLLSF